MLQAPKRSRCHRLSFRAWPAGDGAPTWLRPLPRGTPCVHTATPYPATNRDAASCGATCPALV